MGMSQSYGVPDDTESIATVHRALDLRLDFFDTAQVYGPFSNEELLGRALKGHRQGAIIATKFGCQIESRKITGTNSRPNTSARWRILRCAVFRQITSIFSINTGFDPNVPIEDVTHQGLDTAPRPTLYVPYARGPSPVFGLVMRTAIDPKTVASAAIAAIHGVDKDEAVYNIRTLDDVIASSVQVRRFRTICCPCSRLWRSRSPRWEFRALWLMR